MNKRWTTTLTLFVVAATLLAGCASIQASQARDTERLLAAAGFKTHLVNAGDESLNAAPPHRLVKRTRNGAVEYVYADPDHCRCVYVGGPKEYLAYRRLDSEHLARQQATDDPWAPCDYEGLCWPW
jgi:hypothetical protein